MTRGTTYTPPPDFVSHWARELGSNPESIIQLKGGINNLVYRCGDDNQQFRVIKGYAPLKDGARDRMQAEVDFLKYASIVAPGFTPDLIYSDEERRCVVLEYIKGEVFLENQVPSHHAVKAAIQFFLKLNRDHELAKKMINLQASEGYLNLNAHVENVRQRISSMQVLHLDIELQQPALNLLSDLKLLFSRTRDCLENKILDGLVLDQLNVNECCISPSDFGFHNAIVVNKDVLFFDFEFAGWDDPAKAVTDFLLQPRVPLSIASKANIMKCLRKNNPILLQRITALTPILRLKWICIVLSILNPERLSSMISVNPKAQHIEFCLKRLDKAKELMEAS